MSIIAITSSYTAPWVNGPTNAAWHYAPEVLETGATLTPPNGQHPDDSPIDFDAILKHGLGSSSSVTVVDINLDLLPPVTLTEEPSSPTVIDDNSKENGEGRGDAGFEGGSEFPTPVRSRPKWSTQSVPRPPST